MWARFAEDLSQAALAVRSSVSRRGLRSVIRVDRTVRVLVASDTPVRIGDHTLAPLDGPEATYWLVEMSFDGGEVTRDVAFGGPDPARVTLESIPLGPSEELVLLHDDATDELSLQLVSLADGAARTLEAPRAEGRNCSILPGTPGFLAGVDASVRALTLATACESGSHSVTFAGHTIEYGSPSSVAVYDVTYDR